MTLNETYNIWLSSAIFTAWRSKGWPNLQALCCAALDCLVKRQLQSVISIGWLKTLIRDDEALVGEFVICCRLKINVPVHKCPHKIFTIWLWDECFKWIYCPSGDWLWSQNIQKDMERVCNNIQLIYLCDTTNEEMHCLFVSSLCLWCAMGKGQVFQKKPNKQ